jgi:hypothetical protein
VSGPLTPLTMTATWTNNIGTAVAVNVFSGPLTVPAAIRVPPYPNPWTLTIPLTLPIVYARANGNLLLDIEVSGGSGDNWPADGFFFHASEARGEVTRLFDDPGCATAAGSLVIDVPQQLGNGVLGGNLDVTHTATPAAGAAIDGALHILSLDHRQTGGTPLPLALAAIGAPSCVLQVDPQLTAFVAGANGTQTWPLPAAPAVLGVALFTQAVGIEFATGTLVPARNAYQVRIGDIVAPPGPAQMVHRSNYSGQTTGFLSPTGYYGVVMGFVGSFQ